jgi:hypothetical protein
LSGEFANGYWGATFGEVWQEVFEWDSWLDRHSLRRYCPFSWIIKLHANSIRFIGRSAISYMSTISSISVCLICSVSFRDHLKVLPIKEKPGHSVRFSDLRLECESPQCLVFPLFKSMRSLTDNERISPIRFAEAIIRTHLPFAYAELIQPPAPFPAAQFLNLYHIHTSLDSVFSFTHSLRHFIAYCTFQISVKHRVHKYNGQRSGSTNSAEMSRLHYNIADA